MRLPARLSFIAICSALLAGADRDPEQWVSPGRDTAGTYYSPLTDINTSNASQLGFGWEYQLGTHRGLEATPVVVDGVLYTSGNFGVVYALDAGTGRERWVYDPGVDGQAGRYACCDAVNRGVAVWKGRVYVASLDGYLHAIDAATGKRLWKVDTLPARGPKTPYTVTGAPLIAGNRILIGAGGGDFRGVRGYVAAFDIETGSLQWRFYTVPRDPAQGAQDQPHLIDAVKTWDPHHRWENGGGGPVWDGLSYDPILKLIYIGTGNAAPYDIKEDGRGGGDNLYTACIIALRETGQLAWYYQVVPGDMWDLDSTQKMILADLVVDQKPRQVLMQASKNGFFYVLDRVTGKLISAKPYAFANWTQGIDLKSGRPIPNPAVDYARSPKLIFPWEGGAHSWQPMSFDPRAQRVYIPVMEVGDVQIESAHLPAGLVEGQFTSPMVPAEDYDPKSLAGLYGALPPLNTLAKGLPGLPALQGRAYLRAWDPARQRLVWELPTEAYWDGGVISTAGGLVVQGDIAGRLNVYDASSAKRLASVQLGGSIMAAPMTYRVHGIQFIAVMAGYGGGEIGAPLPENSAAYRYGNQGRIIALKLGGGAVPLPATVVTPPLPRPPAPEGTRAQIDAGEILYNRFCSRCHVLGRGVLPDLRRLTPEKHRLFFDIVLNGILAPLGMGRFDDVLTRSDAQAIHAYIVDQAWAGVRAESLLTPESP
jgi:quinohemoprotein ethanol dehydrogenase